jgi:MFS family permease
MLLASLGTSIANVALPSLARAFGAGFEDVQWVVLAYLLGVTAAIVGAGRLGDIVGRRRLLLAGIALFLAASILCSAAPSLRLLVAARAAQGVGAAIMIALSMALAGEAAPAGRTGRAMGLLGTMSAAGTALGPSLGGVLIDGFGWRSIFLLAVPPAIAAFALVRSCLPAEPSAARGVGGRFDLPGTVLLAVTLGAYAMAMTSGGGSFGATSAAWLAASLAGLLLFLFFRARSASTLIPRGTLGQAGLAPSLVLSLLVSAVLMTTLVVGPFYLSGALGLEAAAVGAVLSLGPAVVIVGGVPAGRAADVLGTRAATFAGLVGIGGGCLLLSLLPIGFGVLGYCAAMVVLTLGYAVFQAANNAGAMAEAGPERRGVVSALLNLSRNVGLITGASLMGAVFAAAAGKADVAQAHPETVAAAMRSAFAGALLLVILALGIAVHALRSRPRG